MVLCLVSPCCLEAYERDTREYAHARPCPDCGAMILMRFENPPHLVIQCQICGHIYERMQARCEPGMPPRCPKCDALAATVLGPDDFIDISGQSGLNFTIL